MKESKPVDFFIVGAAKAGTTTLYSVLKKHRDVFMPELKEINYFSHDFLEEAQQHYGSSIAMVKSLEAYEALYRGNNGHRVTGEVSPSYMEYQGVEARIQKYNPSAKIIFILRNPVYRAISHYLMDKRLGRCQEDLEKIFSRKEGFFFKQYIENGLYAEKIKRYQQIFPSDQIKVIFFEEMTKNMEATLVDLCLFLGVSVPEAHEIEKMIGHENSNLEPKAQWLKLIYQSDGLRRFFKNILGKRAASVIKQLFFTKSRLNDKKQAEEFLRAYYAEDLARLEGMQLGGLNLWKN